MDQNQLIQHQIDEEQRQRDTTTLEHISEGFSDDSIDTALQDHYDSSSDLPEEIFSDLETEMPIVEELITSDITDTEIAPTEDGNEFEIPSQDDLNEIVVDVTSFGLDEEVLGRESLMDAIRNAEKTEANGGSYVDGFTSSIEHQMSERQPDQIETRQPGVEPAPPSERDAAFEKYMDHKNQLEAGRAGGGSWPRDSIDAYHRMGMTYNAYKSGEKIDGMPVTKADVFLSGVKFYQSNIFETAIIRAVKFACNALSDKQEGKVETEQNLWTGVEKDTPLKDDLGAFDSGDATAVSQEDVSRVRVDVPEYGVDYGLDTTKGTSYNSTDNLKIFQPTDYVGKIDIGGGKAFSVPGVRMVDIDGNRALVGPDGKVVHESIRNETALSDTDKSRIESRCDAFESPSAKEQISDMADRRGISVEDLKTQYAEKAMDTYASRVESQMLAEANRLETRTIPEARQELSSFQEDYNKLDKLETAVSRNGSDSSDIQPNEIQNLKAELQTGIDKLETRISAMEDRVDLLRDVRAQVKDATVEDRFSRAVSTEDNAVGRAGRIEYISQDTDTKIMDIVDKGTEKIMADVEKYNAANPESSVSYDADKGEMYNKFGVSESGKYDDRYATVDKAELPSGSPDSVQEHISKHIDTDFDKFKDFDPEKQDAQNDVETNQQPETEVTQPETPPEVDQPAPQPEVETPQEAPQPETTPEVDQPQAETETPEELTPQEAVPEETPVEAPADDVEAESVEDANATTETPQEDPTSVEEIKPPPVEKGLEAEEDIAEAKLVAANDEDSNVASETATDENPSATDGKDVSADERDGSETDQIRDILDSYFDDGDSVISSTDDVIQPITEIFESTGQTDFKSVFDTISDMMSTSGMMADQMDKVNDLLEGLIEGSLSPAEAADMFADSMSAAGFSDEAIDAILTDALPTDMELVAQPLDLEVTITIGDQDLTIADNELLSATSGEMTGGFSDDTAADMFYQDVDKTLYDTGSGVDVPDTGMEVGTPDAADIDSLMPDIEAIQPPDVAIDEGGLGNPETAVEIPGGIEGVEAAEGGAAVEGIEAAALL